MTATALTLVHDKVTQGLRIALAGNPNCGKSSLFNALTGAHQHVANYPGVTVEEKRGRTKLDGLNAEITDLPGTYSLSSFSPEERVAEAELATHPDVVVVVADSTQLKRNLVLLVQVLQAGANPVLCLNMADEAAAAGQRLDVAKMEALLGFPVVETVGHRGEGVSALKAAILKAAKQPLIKHRLVLGVEFERALTVIARELPTEEDARAHEWVALKLLVGDPTHTARIATRKGGQGVIATALAERARLETLSGLEIAVYTAERCFGFVDGLLREVSLHPARANARELTDKIDAVIVHPLLGVPIFAAAMYLTFWLTFSVGEYPMGWIETAVAALGSWVTSLWQAGSESPLRSLLVDGIIAGVGGVLVFLPNILLLFFGLAFMEDTGYMARAAFITDRVMHRFGLHGKSFIPMLTGFGCSIPGIMATRTLENERDRLTTMLVLPLMSCGARLPIWMLLVPAFFPAPWRAPAMFGIYALGIGLAMLLALVVRRTVLRGAEAPFVMELPPYRLPTLKAVVRKMTERSWLYLKKAGTVILGISILMWVLTAYPKPESFKVDRDIAAGTLTVSDDTTLTNLRAAEALEQSFAGRVGKTLEPVFAPLGFDWKIVTAMIGAFAAKEVFVAQMGIVYAMGNVEEAGADDLRQTLTRHYSPWVGLSMMVFLLIGTPCMATFAVTRRESGSNKWALLQFFGLTTLAYLLALVVYQLGSLLSA